MHPFWISGPLISSRAFLIGPRMISNWSSCFYRIIWLFFYICLVVIRMVMHIDPFHPSISIMLKLLIELLKVCIILWKVISRTIVLLIFLRQIMEWVTKVWKLFGILLEFHLELIVLRNTLLWCYVSFIFCNQLNSWFAAACLNCAQNSALCPELLCFWCLSHSYNFFVFFLFSWETMQK